jgi:flagellar basal-body rod protein FlgG
VVEFNDPQRLAQAGGGIYLAGAPGLVENTNPTSTVRQHAIEMANCTPTVEMATLMTAMRTFEANQRAIQLQDERMGKLISELTPA